MSKTVVEFIKSHGVYGRGDVAGFDPDRAAAFIRAGVAKLYDPETKISQVVDSEAAAVIAALRAENEALKAAQSAAAPVLDVPGEGAEGGGVDGADAPIVDVTSEDGEPPVQGKPSAKK